MCVIAVHHICRAVVPLSKSYEPYCCRRVAGLAAPQGEGHLEDGLQLASWLQCAQLAASHGGSLRAGCLVPVQAQPLPQAASVEDKEAGEAVQEEDTCCQQ